MYKSEGVQASFARLMGWTPQYLSRLLKGTNFGLKPIIAIIKKFPEINARWFMTGEGEMLSSSGALIVQREALNNAISILELGKYIPVMNAEDISKYLGLLGGKNGMPDIATIDTWKIKLSEYNQRLDAIFASAQSKARENANGGKSKNNKPLL